MQVIASPPLERFLIETHIVYETERAPPTSLTRSCLHYASVCAQSQLCPGHRHSSPTSRCTCLQLVSQGTQLSPSGWGLPSLNEL